MSNKESNVVLNFKMDGQVEYAKTIREINAIMNAAASEYKTHVAAMGQDADQTQKLAAEKKKLEIQLEAGKKRTEQLRSEYDAMSKSSKTTTGQLAAKHNQLMNSERAEMALERALERVNDGLSEQAIESRNAEQALNQLESQSDRLDSVAEKLNAEYELQKEQLGDNAHESEKLALKMAHLNDTHDVAKQKVENYENQLEQAKKQYGENSAEVDRYEIQLLEARTAEQRLANEIDVTNRALNDQVRKLDDVSKSLKDTGRAMEDIGKNMSLKITAPVVALGGSLVATGIEFKAFKEEAKQAFSVLLGSAEAAEEHMDRIMEFAKTTPFAFPDLVSANRKLVSFGMAAEETEPVMEAIANAVAAMGGGAQEIDTLADVFAKIESGGKITGEELNRLSDNGINALAILANQADLSMEEMRKQISAGAIDSESAINGLVDGIMNGSEGIAGETAKLGGSLDALSGTWKGAIDSMKGAWRRAGDEMVSDDMFEKITESVGKATEVIGKLPELLGPIMETLTDVLMGLIDKVSLLIDWFMDLDPAMQQIVVKLGLAVVAAGPLIWLFGKMVTTLGTVVGGIKSFILFFGKIIPIFKAVGAVIAGVSAPVWGIIAVIAALIAIGVALWKNWDVIKEKVIALKDMIVEKFTEFKENAGKIVSEFVANVISKFNEFKENLAARISEIRDNIVTFFTETIPEAFNRFVDFVSELPARIMEFLNKLFLEDIPYAIGYGIGWLITTVSEGIDSAVEFFKEMPGRVLEFLTEAIANITQWANDTKEKAIETGTEFLSNIVNFFQQLPGRVAAFLLTVISNVTTWVADMRAKATEAGLNFLNNVLNFFKQLPGQVWDFLTETISRMVEFAGDMKDKALEAGKNVYETIVEEVGKIPDRLKELGSDIISGLVQGVRESISNVVGIAKDIADNLVSGFKRAMGIESPSRIMRELGRFITEGLGIGIDDMAKSAIDKTVNVAKGITGAMRDGVKLPDLEIGTVVRQPEFDRPASPMTAISNIGSNIKESLSGLTGEMVVHVYLDSGQLNSQLAPGMSVQLNQMNKFNARSQGVIIL